MKRLPILLLAASLSACTSMTLLSPDGKSSMSGSMTNGSLSYSEGNACTPAQPNPAVAPPPIQPTPMTAKRVCDGANCINMMVPMSAADGAPTCYTRVETVKGTDITTYFAWGLGAVASIIAEIFLKF